MYQYGTSSVCLQNTDSRPAFYGHSVNVVGSQSPLQHKSSCRSFDHVALPETGKPRVTAPGLVQGSEVTRACLSHVQHNTHRGVSSAHTRNQFISSFPRIWLAGGATHHPIITSSTSQSWLLWWMQNSIFRGKYYDGTPNNLYFFMFRQLNAEWPSWIWNEFVCCFFCVNSWTDCSWCSASPNTWLVGFVFVSMHYVYIWVLDSERPDEAVQAAFMFRRVSLNGVKCGIVATHF